MVITFSSLIREVVLFSTWVKVNDCPISWNTINAYCFIICIIYMLYKYTIGIYIFNPFFTCYATKNCYCRYKFDII